MRLEALDRLDADDALVLGLVREHRRAGDVADGVDAGHVGAVERSTTMMPRSVFTPTFSRPRPSTLPTTPTAEMTRSTVSVCVPPLPSSMVAVTPSPFLSSFVTLAPVRILMPCFSKLLAREGGDLGVLDGQDLRQHLDHRHLGAERAVERGELDADRAGADDQQRLRHAVRHHRLEIGPDQLPVGLEPGQHARPRAGRDDDVLGLIGAGAERALRRLALAGLHGDLAGRFDRRLAPDHRHLVLLHQEADAVVEPLRHRARALHHGGRIEAHLLGRQPVILGVLHVVENLGRAQQRLGRDAAPVEADAAEILALDDRGLEAELRRADGGDIAARSGADDDDVEGGVSH